MFAETQTAQKHSCYHCGDSCNSDTIKHEEKVFCCDGCKMVYEIINDKGLCDYYDIEKNPGLSQKIKVREGKFAFLEDETVKSRCSKPCYFLLATNALQLVCLVT
jgi:Cu+-exporting ATPase